MDCNYLIHESGYFINYYIEHLKSNVILRYQFKPVVSTGLYGNNLYSEHEFEYESQTTEKSIIKQDSDHNILEVASIEVTKNKSIQTCNVLDSFENYVFYKYSRKIEFTDIYNLYEKHTINKEKFNKTTGNPATFQLTRKFLVPMTIPDYAELYKDSNFFEVSEKITACIPKTDPTIPMIKEFNDYLNMLLSRQKTLVDIIQKENNLKNYSLISTSNNNLYTTNHKYIIMDSQYIQKDETLYMVWFKCVECVAVLQMYLRLSINNIRFSSFIFHPSLKSVKIINLLLCETDFSSLGSQIGDFSYNYYEHNYKANPYAKPRLYNGSDRDLYSLCVLFFNMLAKQKDIYWWQYSGEASDYLNYPFVLICLLFYEMEDVREKIFKLEDEIYTKSLDVLSSELINLFTLFSYKDWISERCPDKYLGIGIYDEPVYEENETNKLFQSIRNKLLKNDTTTINNTKIYVKAYEDNSKLTPGEIDRILLESKDSFQAFLDSKHSKRVKLDDTSAPMVYDSDSDNLTELSYLSEND